ncbi:hypothetical protein LVJ94_17585 [Pendulispora rubella]|uniref:Uncharacterized protein n=1 Tax=Pendulispora rubella TaxID=2741070 RepID=A0ABZ2LE39_9BACT
MRLLVARRKRPFAGSVTGIAWFFAAPLLLACGGTQPQAEEQSLARRDAVRPEVADAGLDSGWAERAKAAQRELLEEAAKYGIIGEAEFVHSVSIELDDPASLGHLQAAWAAAIWLTERGSSVTLDAHASRWHESDAVARLEPNRAFDLDHEVNFVAEADATPGLGHVMHTRGLLKFARPDLVTAVALQAMTSTEPVIRRLAEWFVNGAMVAPGHRFDLDDHLAVSFEPYTPGRNAPDVHLNNDGIYMRLESTGTQSSSRKHRSAR